MTEREKIRHLLRRFGLGASEAELEYYVPLGLRGTVDRLLENAKDFESEALDPMIFANRQGVVNIRVAQGIWYLRMLTTTKPLLEKVALFWHNHFATSASKVTNSYSMMEQIDTFRRHGLGSFRTLIGEVSQDPAMLFWLDNNLNVKGKANENFAREVMELFTLGIGNYTESDVQEAARAFTGWGYGFGLRTAGDRAPRRRERFVFDRSKHDTGDKKIFGKQGQFDGDDVLDMLCANPQTARYIAQKAWRFFGGEKAPSAALERATKAFAESGLDLSILFRTIMLDPEFYGETTYKAQIKNPVDFTIPMGRQLGIGALALDRIKAAQANPVVNEQSGLNVGLVRGLAPAFAVAQSTKAMGMELLYPPDVNGWGYGDSWISSATMVARIKWSDALFAGGAPLGRANIGGNLAGGNRGPALGAVAFPLLQGDPTPEGVVARLCSVFDADVPVAVYQDFVEAARLACGGRVTASNANETGRAVMKLLCGLPSFQMN